MRVLSPTLADECFSRYDVCVGVTPRDRHRAPRRRDSLRTTPRDDDTGHHDHRDVHTNNPAAAPNPPPAAAKTLRAWCNVRAAARCFSLVTKGGGAGGGDAGLRTVDFEVEMDGRMAMARRVRILMDSTTRLAAVAHAAVDSLDWRWRGAHGS